MERSTAYAPAYITTATTTQVKLGPGLLARVCINIPVSAGTITIYDNVSSDTTNPRAIITSTADLKPFFIDFNYKFLLGLKIVTTQAQNITVMYS